MGRVRSSRWSLRRRASAPAWEPEIERKSGVCAGSIFLLFVALALWLRWMAAAPSVRTLTVEPMEPVRGAALDALPGAASLPGGEAPTATDSRPEQARSALHLSRELPGGRKSDTELAILEEEAARTALRRGLAPASGVARGSVGPADGASGGRGDSESGERNAREPDAERRTLSDELLVDHLVSDTYRTTLFPPEMDAVAESRAAARSLLASIPAEERRELLRAALGSDAGADRPVYQELPGAAAD